MNCSGMLKIGVLSFVLRCAICQASPITVDLTSTVLQSSGGSTVTFSGVLSNSASSAIFLNSAGINLAGPFNTADEDLAPFFTNAPLFLNASASIPVIDLFTPHLPSPFATGSYSGTFTILGGVDANAMDLVGSAGFAVQVVNATAVPEPAPGALIAFSGVVLLIARIVSLRKRSPGLLRMLAIGRLLHRS